MKKIKLTSFLMVSMCVVMLVGCNKEKDEAAEIIVEAEEKNMFGLTESEQKMYAEYAAGALMKYNAGSNMRVLEGQTLINQEAKEQEAKEQAEKRAQLAAEYEANKKNNSNKNNTSSSSGESSEGSGVNYISDMSQVTGTNAFSIVYDGYEITDSYPNSGDDILMAMDATSGKLLMVTKYKVTNTSGQTENFDMFSKKGKFRLDLNGKRYKSQYTLLLDDLSMYKGDLDAGETIEGVLIFEIPESAASNVEDMVLSITIGDEVASMQLKGGSSVSWTTTNVEEVTEEDSLDSDQENVDTSIEGEESHKESDNANVQDVEYNDLAEEYMEALEAENAGESYDEGNLDSTSGNVTVVGSSRN